MLERKAPLSGGIETYIDMVEREMEGGVYVQFPLDTLVKSRETRLEGLVEIEEETDVHDLTDD